MHNSIHIHARRSNVNDYPKDYGSSNISSNSEILGPVFTTRFPGCATHQSQSNGLNATIDQWDRLFTLTAHSQYQQYVHTDWGKFAFNLRERTTSLYRVFKDWYNSWRQTDDASIYYFFLLASLSLLPLPFWWRSRCLTPTTNQWQSTWSKSRTDA